VTSGRHSRSQRIVGIILVFSTVVLVAGVVERLWVSGDHAEARAELDAALEHRNGLTAELQQVQVAIDLAVNKRADDESGTAEIIDTVFQLVQVRDQLESTKSELARVQSESDAAVQQTKTLAACLEALDTTRRHLERGDPPAARTTLQAGSAACQQAAAIAEGSDDAVYPYDFADPFLLADGGRYFAFGTNGAVGQVQVLTSNDQAHWHIVGSALPALPGWARSGNTWSPAVTRNAEGFVLYYTVREGSSGKQCISAAFSTAPQGPYLDLSAAPLICQVDLGGSIDPSPYTDAYGTTFLTWKSEDETVGGSSQLWAQQLGPDLISLVGEPVVIASADRAWEAGIIEGPSMAFVDGAWTLLYSGNRWSGGDYAVGVAVCDGPLGPCRKARDNVVLRSGGRYAGPGGAEFFVDRAGRLAVVFSAWDGSAIGYPHPRRFHVAAVARAPGGGLAIHV
jgi:hypothetical protein